MRARSRLETFVAATEKEAENPSFFICGISSDPMPAASDRDTPEATLMSLWRWRLERLRALGGERIASPYTIAMHYAVLDDANRALAALDLELALDPNLPAINAVASQMSQVILNLVVNAAHAIGDVVARAPGMGITT